MDETKTLLRDAVSKWNSNIEITDIDVIAPDASLRRYYRLHLKGGEVDRLVAMVFDSVTPAEAGDGPVINSNTAYVELTRYFENNGWPVPQLYFEADTGKVLLIEDLGSTLLCYTVVGSRSNAFSSAQTDELYKQAVELIASLQQMPADNSFFPFQRGFNEALYRKEIDEFREFVFLPQRPAGGKQNLLSHLFDELVKQLCSMERVLVHRDFHSWNLLIDANQSVRVIDFQDACLGTPAYDLVALLNDRDTDSCLGPKRGRMLLEYFIDISSFDDSFYDAYYLTLLQRDLKVAGRFTKLVKVRGLTAYEEWIPGTMGRIGRTLALISERRGLSTSGAMLEVLEEMFPNIKERRQLPEA
ncbi:MAG: phosphotransferase [Bdellovibrionales bacterium]|nr:phosphotransferase [Bdellovibrionales bacterium]